MIGRSLSDPRIRSLVFDRNSPLPELNCERTVVRFVAYKEEQKHSHARHTAAPPKLPNLSVTKEPYPPPAELLL